MQCEYYKQHADLFLKYFEKAKSSARPDITAIHNLRKEIKKIRSLNSLLIYISDKTANKQKIKDSFSLLKKIFQISGNLREIQLNLTIIKQHKLSPLGLSSYLRHMKAQEKELLGEFKKETARFNIKKYEKSIIRINKICQSINKKKFESKSLNFIKNEISKINKLKKKSSETNKYHDIRIHLKKLAAILELLAFVMKVKKYKIIINIINKTELKLGNWHDNLILKNSVYGFLSNKSKNSFVELRNLYMRLNKTSNVKAELFDANIKSVLKLCKFNQA